MNLEYAKYRIRDVHSFFDAWILMLALGGLSHQLHIPRLAISYWSAWLVMIVSICLIPGSEYPVRIAKPSSLEKWAEERKKKK